MVGPFAVDGYDVLAPLDEAGRRWRAIRLDDRRPVVLRRWIGAADRRAEVRRQAALWSSVAGAAVVEVLDVVCAGADLVVISASAGEFLDAVLARRRSLTPGQVVTLVAGVAETLTVAHDRGLAHGRLDARSVVLDDTGRPQLTDVVFGADADRSSDVAALVAMVSGFVDDATPAALMRALESAVEARGLADGVVSATRAEPLLSSPVVTAPTVVASRVPTGGRMPALVVVTTAVAVLATVIGVWWGRQEPAAGAPPPPRIEPTPRSTATAPSWRVVVAGLEQRRVHALAHADAGELASVESADSALWRRDARTVSRLLDARLHFRNLSVDVRRAVVVSTSPTRVVVRVVDAMSSYDVVNARGVVVERQRARQPRQVTLVLVREEDRWKIRAVSRRSP